MTTVVKTHFPLFKHKGCRKCHTSGILFRPMWVVYDDLYSTRFNGAIFRYRVYMCKQCKSSITTTKDAAVKFYHKYVKKVMEVVG